MSDRPIEIEDEIEVPPEMIEKGYEAVLKSEGVSAGILPFELSCEDLKTIIATALGAILRER